MLLNGQVTVGDPLEFRLYSWEPIDPLADDVRFKSHCLAPKSAADFAFLLHGFHYLQDLYKLVVDIWAKSDNMGARSGPLAWDKTNERQRYQRRQR